MSTLVMKTSLLITLFLIAFAVSESSAQQNARYWLPGHGEPPLSLDEAYKKAAAAVAKLDTATVSWTLNAASLSPTYQKGPTVWAHYSFTFSRLLVRTGPRQQCTVTIRMNGEAQVFPIKNEP